MVTLKEAIYKTVNDMENPCRDKEEMVGVSTGLKSLDRIFSGLRPGRLIVIGGRPGIGKMAMALNWTLAVAKSLRPVAIFSYELLSEDISMRMLISEAKVDSKKVEAKIFNTKEIISISEAVKTLSSLPVFIEDHGGISLDDIREMCINIKKKSGLGMVIIDSFQLIPYLLVKRTRKEGQELLSKCLKELSIELEVPVVVISQIKSPEEGIRPQLDDLCDAGSLIHEADVVCLIHRDDYFDPNTILKGIAEIIVAKNREGEPRTTELKWIGSQRRFGDL